MNRAVDGDIVAVEMFPESEWSAPSSLVLTDSGDTVEEDDDEEKVVSVLNVIVHLT